MRINIMSLGKLLFIIPFLFASCKKNHELFYSTDTNTINIWLGNTVIVEDSVTYNFAYTVTGRDSVMFNYRIAGFPLDHDARFELKAVSGDTGKVHYSFGDYVIPAGSYAGQFPIYIDKPAGYSEFKSGVGEIVFKLKESPLFGEGAKELTALTLKFRNYVAKPDNWDAATSPYFTMARYFGAYSDVKYAFIIQTTGMANFKIYYTVAKDPVLEENTITATKADYLKNLCKNALQQYNELHGPLMDENNNEVIFP
jgi:hypothetical protein